MPKPYPKEFCEGFIRVVLNLDENTTIGQIAKAFGVHEATLGKWILQVEIDAGNKPGDTAEDSAELRVFRRRARLLEYKDDVLRHAVTYLSQANLSS